MVRDRVVVMGFKDATVVTGNAIKHRHQRCAVHEHGYGYGFLWCYEALRHKLEVLVHREVATIGVWFTM